MLEHIRIDIPANYIRAGETLTLVNVNGATYRVVRKGTVYAVNGRRYSDGCTWTVLETCSNGSHGGVWFFDEPVQALLCAKRVCEKGGLANVTVNDYQDDGVSEFFLKMTRDIDDNTDSPLPF